MATVLLLVLMLSIFLIPALPHYLNNLSRHHQQQQLLLQFKATVSRNGTSLVDWTPLHHFCNWSAITCYSNSHFVRAINLTEMSLDGTISPHFDPFICPAITSLVPFHLKSANSHSY
ncbi:hypothetical protein SUGI_0556950 [Cryptomeria japonica]|nr:hypothetical protein SUGI_0556950 [Cryptomeria japonica]